MYLFYFFRLPFLTFFTLCGFFSLRHLRMSISVVLTQPGCGRRQEAESVSGSYNSISPACMVCACPHTMKCWFLFSNATLAQGSDAWRPNLVLLLTTKQLFLLNIVWSNICCFQALNTKIVLFYWFISISALLFYLTLLSLSFSPDSPPADGRPRMPSPGCPESSSLPCPSFCRSCQQRKWAAHAESTCLWNIRSKVINETPESSHTPLQTHTYTQVYNNRQASLENQKLKSVGLNLSARLTKQCLDLLLVGAKLT